MRDAWAHLAYGAYIDVTAQEHEKYVPRCVYLAGAYPLNYGMLNKLIHTPYSYLDRPEKPVYDHTEASCEDRLAPGAAWHMKHCLLVSLISFMCSCAVSYVAAYTHGCSYTWVCCIDLVIGQGIARTPIPYPPAC